MRKQWLWAGLLALFAGWPACAGAQEGQWWDGFALPGMDQTVYATCTDGQDVIAGGSFSQAGTSFCNCARGNLT